MTKSIITLTALATLSSAVFAGDTIMVSPPIDDIPQQPFSLYRAHEIQIDVFGSYVFEDDDNHRLFSDDDGSAGGGIGVNYFFTENFGIGLEGMLFDTDGDSLGSTALNLFLRMPLGSSGLSIYGIAGAGIVFNADNLNAGNLDDDFNDAFDRLEDDIDDDDEHNVTNSNILFEAHIGAGVEYRFTENLGLFTEARYTYVDLDDGDYPSARLGIRVAL